MKYNQNEKIEHYDCPVDLAEALKRAGGVNRYGEPMFRVVWGYNRIVPMTGEWQEFEHMLATLTDKLTGHTQAREFIRLKESKIETRMVPKYLPAACWHLEMWRPPEEYACYGPKENWTKLGQEVIGGMTIDCAGPFPERGEYELCYPLTSDLTCNGTPVPLSKIPVEWLTTLIVRGRDFTLAQRKAALEQRAQAEENGFTRKAVDIMKDGMRPFCSETFVTVPEEVN